MMDTQRALVAVERLQNKLKERGEMPTEEKLSLLKSVLQSPLFHQILIMQETGQQQPQQQDSPMTPQSQSMSDDVDSVNASQPNCTLRYRDSYLSAQRSNDRSTNQVTFDPCVAEDISHLQYIARGRTVLSFDVERGESALGIRIIAVDAESSGGHGIFIQEIRSGSVADSDGRLCEDDQILAINGKLIDSSVTHEQAVKILQEASSTVTLTVARGPVAEAKPPQMSHTPRQIHLIELQNDGSGLGFGIVGGRTTGTMVKTILPEGPAGKDGRLRSGDLLLQIGHVDVSSMSIEEVAQELHLAGTKVKLLIATADGDLSSPIARQQDTQDSAERKENDFSRKRLAKNGLGVNIAKSTENLDTVLEAGEFVIKSILKGSRTESDGQIHTGDHIVAVDDQSLNDCGEPMAEEILDSTGQHVEVYLLNKNSQSGTQASPTISTTSERPLTPMDLLPPPPPPHLPEPKSVLPHGKVLYTERHDLNFNRESIESKQTCYLESKMENCNHQSSLQKLSEEDERKLKDMWQSKLGPQYEIMVAQVEKFSESSGLGVSLDTKEGHHYICSILPEGPVGQSGIIRPGDELLEVNGSSLIGETHKEVVCLLKELPVRVCVVCSRLIPTTLIKEDDADADADDNDVQLTLKELLAEFNEKAEQNLISTDSEDDGKTDAPVLSHQAMWENEIHVYELQKGHSGLGFSVLDYQDPMNPGRTVIVIRSLVASGLAERDGRLLPGDRLMLVNGTDLSHASLAEAVHVLKSTALGTVHIGVSKPLPENDTQDTGSDVTGKSYSAHNNKQGFLKNNFQSHNSKMEAGSKAISVPSSGFDRTVTIVRGNSSLGMTVSALRDGSGMIIRSVVHGGSIGMDGRLAVGDGIIAVNGESTTDLTNAQARALLRRHSLIGPDLSVMYIPAAFLEEYRASFAQSKQEMETHHPTTIESKPPLNLPFKTLECISEQQSKVDGRRVNGKIHVAEVNDSRDNPSHIRQRENGERRDEDIQAGSKEMNGQSAMKDKGEEEPHRKDHSSWSCPNRVTLFKAGGTCLGISVVGGRGMGSRLSNGEMRRGIFIKHIAEDSPAARSRVLKEGDRILQVGGVDVSDFTHEEAVEAIRRGGNRVELLVQSPRLSTPVNCHEEDNLSKTNDQEHEIPNNLSHLSPTCPFSPAPFKRTGEEKLGKPNIMKVASRPLDTEANGVQKVPERPPLPEETSHHQSDQEQTPYWSRVLQRYGSLPGELHMFELDCSSHSSGLGLCLSGNRDGARGRMSVYVSEIKPDGAAAADGRIRVGDELLEINGQVLYGRSHQNATAIISSASAKVRVLLTRSKAKLKQMATGPVLEMDGCPVKSPSTASEGQHQDGRISEEDKLKSCSSEKLNAGLPASINATSNHKLPCHPASHTPSSRCSPLSSDISSADESRSCGFTANQSSRMGPQSTSYLAQCSVTSVPLTCPIVPGCINIIDICKGYTGLGLSIVGGCNTALGVIMIHEVNKGGAAHRDGRLWAGDHILEVNGIDLRMATHEEALSVLRLSPQRVRLCIYRDQVKDTLQNHTIHTPEDMWDLFSVDLNLELGLSLGFGIVGKRNDTGIFVSEIKRGGVADLDGRLLLGDQILSVNGDDIRAASQEYASALLQSCTGSVLFEVARFKALPYYSYGDQPCEVDVPHLSSLCTNDSADENVDIRTVTVQRHECDSVELGVRDTQGHATIYISNLDPTTPAAQSGLLQLGAGLISINGTATENLSVAEVKALLRNSSGPVTLQVMPSGCVGGAVFSKDQSSLIPSSTGLLENQQSSPQFQTIALERGSAGLGFTIVGGIGSSHGDLPIYVKNVFSKGAAVDDGRLLGGDQLLAVNGRSLEGVTHTEAVEILRQTSGPVTLQVLSNRSPTC
ncbi:LOW QUALITY PROTEIN: multiple PDZ domain protein [Triplophysa dalaica]|uniref:LOW QUALITY PROTEIN: multiple PDZ domain protein n=1 Tax=Triplophysa dalaica TaxID=1582913 RepID=UPI0024DF39BE|nr:LOW QUALITY PROTEIN: multiple PDZ domain protein [Triplophysa dalaica]